MVTLKLASTIKFLHPSNRPKNPPKMKERIKELGIYSLDTYCSEFISLTMLRRNMWDPIFTILIEIRDNGLNRIWFLVHWGPKGLCFLCHAIMRQMTFYCSISRTRTLSWQSISYRVIHMYIFMREYLGFYERWILRWVLCVMIINNLLSRAYVSCRALKTMMNFIDTAKKVSCYWSKLEKLGRKNEDFGTICLVAPRQISPWINIFSLYNLLNNIKNPGKWRFRDLELIISSSTSYRANWKSATL